MESGLCMFNDHMQMDLRAGVTTIMMLFWSAVVGVVWNKQTQTRVHEQSLANHHGRGKREKTHHLRAK